jgi:ubiquinone/menaquinone biosynthesis C-methylase UbiE
MSWWENVYKGSPPWDIGGQQPEIVKLVENNEIKKGRVLDIGCGLGDNSIFLAKSGFSVTCMDISNLAVEKGEAKAREQAVKIDFRVGDALELDKYFGEGYFAVVIDSGLFHSLGDDERTLFANQIRRVLIDRGKYFVLCFSDKEPGSEGPRRISKKEIRDTFSKMFRINYIKDTFFAAKLHRKGAKAYIASMTKIAEI